MEISLGDIPMTHRIIPPYVCIYSRAYILLCVLLLLSFFSYSCSSPVFRLPIKGLIGTSTDTSYDK